MKQNLKKKQKILLLKWTSTDTYQTFIKAVCMDKEGIKYELKFPSSNLIGLHNF